eukprot:COSAG06_NODE_44096_length_366_cov_0.775281_1_plen_29_part_10
MTETFVLEYINMKRWPDATAKSIIVFQYG